MRFLTISDVVSAELYPVAHSEALEPLDAVLSCGDVPPEYLTYLGHVFRVPVFYVRGNHDLRYARRPPQGATHVHGRLVHFKGLRIVGFEGSMWYNGGPMQYTETQMQWTVWKTRPLIWWHGGVDIVLAHAPPRGFGDGNDLCHRGFRCFVRFIRSHQPRWFLHGHVHRTFHEPSQRLLRLGDTIIVNTVGWHILDTDHETMARSARALQPNTSRNPRR
ncbi:MAG: metallophosphoesterase family protein [Desulfosoma sp.]|uniref:metallophosphoesterase family protein n=1 Tax=Desulfosoma sp. TaxID=2603217 RepID=UPI00404ACD87